MEKYIIDAEQLVELRVALSSLIREYEVLDKVNDRAGVSAEQNYYKTRLNELIKLADDTAYKNLKRI